MRLKLITLGQQRPGARPILALADEAAAKPLRAKSWLAEALSTFKVEVLVANLDPEVRADIRAAQVRQVMVNTAPATDPGRDRRVAADRTVIMRRR